MGISGKRNRTMGHVAERHYASLFREIGFPLCITSREGSKLHDDAKIDLMNIPFNIQIKAGKQTQFSPGKELFAMKCAIDMMFLKDDAVFKRPMLAIHHVALSEGERRRTDNHSLVYMTLEQFNKFKVMNPEFEYQTIKKSRFEHEFATIVSMTFEVFKKDIILKHYIQC